MRGPYLAADAHLHYFTTRLKTAKRSRGESESNFNPEVQDVWEITREEFSEDRIVQ